MMPRSYLTGDNHDRARTYPGSTGRRRYADSNVQPVASINTASIGPIADSVVGAMIKLQIAKTAIDGIASIFKGSSEEPKKTEQEDEPMSFQDMLLSVGVPTKIAQGYAKRMRGPGALMSALNALRK